MVVVDLLHARLPELRTLAAQIIGSFSLVTEGVTLMSSTTVAMTLAEMLQEKSLLCKKAAAKALYNMSEVLEGARFIISTAGCVQLICRAISYPSLEVYFFYINIIL